MFLIDPGTNIPHLYIIRMHTIGQTKEKKKKKNPPPNAILSRNSHKEM